MRRLIVNISFRQKMYLYFLKEVCIFLCIYSVNCCFTDFDVGKRLENFTFKTFGRVSAFECAAECIAYEICKSFNYDENNRMCSLNYEDGISKADSVAEGKNFMYSDITLWTQVRVTPCQNVTCAHTGACRVNRNNKVYCGGYKVYLENVKGNVAVGKPASSSSHWGTFSPDKAADGNTDPAGDSGSCFAVNNDDPTPWWQLDLLNNYLVKEVNVTARTENHGRLRDFELRLYDENPSLVSDATSQQCNQYEGAVPEPGYTVSLPCQTLMTGRYLRLIGASPDHSQDVLQFCEVQVTFKLHCLPMEVQDAMKVDDSIKVGLLGSLPELGSMQVGKMLAGRPSSTQKDVWFVVAWLPMSSTFTWSWAVTSGDSVKHWDSATNRRTSLNYFNGVLEATWGRHQTFFLSQTCAINVRTQYRCGPGETLAMLGSEPSLGSWDPAKALHARECPVNSSYWVAETFLDSSTSYSWKWVVLDAASGKVKRFEERSNRHLVPNCGNLVMDARWNCASYIQHQGPIVLKRGYFNMTEVNIPNYHENTSNAGSTVASKWLSVPNYETSIAVADHCKPVIEDPSPRKPTWRSFIRRIPLLSPLPIIGHVYDWFALVE